MASPTAIRSERADSRANRLRVLEAARQAFAEHGLSAEIKDIAELAGVGVGTVYRGFGSKTDLLSAVADQAAEGFENLIARAESEQDPVKGLRNLLTAAVEFTDAYGWLFQLFLSGRFPADARPGSGHHQNFDQRLRRLLERGIQTGAYRSDLPIDVAAVLIQGALLSLLTPLSRQKAGDLSGRDFADGIIGLLSPP